MHDNAIVLSCLLQMMDVNRIRIDRPLVAWDGTSMDNKPINNGS